MKTFVSAVVLGLVSAVAVAQGDAKPIRFIVPFGPGSSVDTQGRFFAEQLSQVLKVPTYVENKPGATGALGLQALKAAPADGRSIAVVSPSFVVTPIMSRTAGYKVDDFKPIAGMGKGPIGFFVRADSKYKSLGDLLAAAKKDGQPVNMGTYAGSYKIGAAWLSQLSGVPFTDIPYKSASNTMTDLMGGSLEVMSADFTAMAPMVREGKLRALAIADERRLSEFADVPTVNESYKGYVNYIWLGLVVRADTPQPIVDNLSRAMQQVMAKKETHDYLAQMGWQPLNLDGPAMGRFIQAENKRFQGVAKTAGITPE